MTETQLHRYRNTALYIPQSLSEVSDQLGSMILWAPTFTDRLGHFPDQNIDTMFKQLTEGFGGVRVKLGEDNYAALIGLAQRAKALFADDPDDTNGKTNAGRQLLLDIEDVINSVRRTRTEKKLPDDEGRITGD